MILRQSQFDLTCTGLLELSLAITNKIISSCSLMIRKGALSLKSWYEIHLSNLNNLTNIMIIAISKHLTVIKYSIKPNQNLTYENKNYPTSTFENF